MKWTRETQTPAQTRRTKIPSTLACHLYIFVYFANNYSQVSNFDCSDWKLSESEALKADKQLSKIRVPTLYFVHSKVWIRS